MATRDNAAVTSRKTFGRRGTGSAAAAATVRRSAGRWKNGRANRTVAGKAALRRRHGSRRRRSGRLGRFGRRGARAAAWRRYRQAAGYAGGVIGTGAMAGTDGAGSAGAASRISGPGGRQDRAAKALSPGPAAIPPPLLPAPGPASLGASGAAWSAAEAERVRAAAFEAGYREGLFEGGEAKLGRLIPRYMLLPEIWVDDVIAAGFPTVAGQLYPLLTPAEVFAAAEGALREGRPLSIVRLGDGELLTLAHDTVISTEEALRRGAFLPYAGVHLPDPAAREALAAAIRAADIIGVPESRHPSYQGLLFPVLRHYGIDYRGLRLTTSTVNYELNAGGYLTRLLHGRRVLLIGNQAEVLAGFLGHRSVQVVGWLAPVQGVADVPRVAMRLREFPDFDLALVAAGVAAVMICTRLSGELGKVALDMGHLADKLIKGEAAWPQLGEVHIGANGV
ncbi:GT-D fold domain-containing glycosyltransferase [Paenibacillus sp. MB22_1]|uniref:GT-D fold domain-containing glycosyltransferase n=1 Tax=Paenibacillus sp. MB22_1 TaxID=3383121 RepID=UPI0039A1AA51